MKPSPNCYSVHRKPLTRVVLDAFAAGVPGGARMVTDHNWRPGLGVFYGVLPELVTAWRACAAADGYVYIDRGYFGRETQFRATLNALQHSGVGEPDDDRLAALGVEIEPWRAGRHILLCVQSDWWHRQWCGLPATAWEQKARWLIGKHTVRPVVTRWTVGEKNGAAARESFRRALDGVHAVVTWNSSAAVEAICAGVPAVVLGQSAASPMATPLEEIERPRRPEGRRRWAGVLAAQQWTLAELADGTCWRALMGDR